MNTPTRSAAAAFALLALSLLLASLAGGQEKAKKQKESDEPPLSYTLKVADKSCTIFENKPLTLKGEFKDPVVKLTAASYRVFPYQGISFKYPRYFTFEADFSDVILKIWTLSGKDCDIMYQVFPVKITAKEFIDDLVSEFGKDNCKVSDSKVTLGKHTLLCTSLRTTIIGNRFFFDVYSIPTKKGGKLLIFQGSLDDSGKKLKEAEETFKLIKESFEIKK